MNIAEAVKKSGTFSVMSKGSIRAAERILSANESLIYATVVNMAIEPTSQRLDIDTFNIKNKINGVFVVTNRRIFFCNSVLGVGKTKQMELGNITSIDDKTSLIGLTKLRIRGITEMFVIDGNAKINSQIQQAINEAIASFQ